jgi:hypothetical protein
VLASLDKCPRRRDDSWSVDSSSEKGVGMLSDEAIEGALITHFPSRQQMLVSRLIDVIELIDANVHPGYLPRKVRCLPHWRHDSNRRCDRQ